jgi:hypothetical protein
MRCRELCLLLCLAWRALAAAAAARPPRIAIVGGGIGGSAAAYFASRWPEAPELHV